jgi:hypothetical protein
MKKCALIPLEGPVLKLLEKEILCENCQFWQNIDHRGFMGECRKNSPVRAPEYQSGFPRAYFRHWCGEHKFSDEAISQWEKEEQAILDDVSRET